MAALLVLLCAGCSLAPEAPDDRAAALPDSYRAMLVDAHGDSATADVPARLPACATQYPELATIRSAACAPGESLGVCLTFDTDQPQPDGSVVVVNSAPSAGPAKGTNLLYEPGADGLSVRLDASGTIHLPASVVTQPYLPAFDAWVFIDTPPAQGARFGLMDDSLAFSAFFYGDDPLGTREGLRVQCGSGRMWSTALMVGQWNHVACVNDGVAARLYINGNVEAEVAAAGGGDFTAQDFISLGANHPDFADVLPGRLDTVRIWSTTPSAEDICRAAILWDGD